MFTDPCFIRRHDLRASELLGKHGGTRLGTGAAGGDRDGLQDRLHGPAVALAREARGLVPGLDLEHMARPG